ncbi:MAG TPA: 4-hydroxybenzoate octaprenyltransferase [Alphaproteobacteria bacterium]|jgi:4-hydroxybenzoate polyprenyltransferase|nr:4-hydroxybenzoate octaprenyltransferase [Alphaproteobacteria bacterium]HAM48893.1 4-hydroxybenzoate octaprenyltransferase [Alphaproteobacteria bacterium]HBA42351.1 4-hydroxybenzoate octaprenyltransferase [Alphaproteobacteria bacterium]HBC55277.1 4-hydroxybenzoate octaprenyltransferase [Alphaproteobacteria bacterium]HBF99214.1 4-hydroxybenzoate octaprenyltransferase [Alphaproteobacteria bacterium]
MTDDEQKDQAADPTVADTTGNWVDRWAPAQLRPYLRLARMDRPIGTWLLLWPCWWSLAMAVPIAGGWPSLWMFAAFGVGAVVMRGAGCTFNDIVDRDLDAKVARTANRPLPAGKVTLVGAGLFLFAQCILGLAILFSFNSFAVTIGLLSVGLVVIYPFMKRVTYWPQLFLGLTFNWGALLGWAAHSGSLSVAAWLLYCGGIFWTIGYDTIYAHQDKEDDALIGVKSSALRLGARTGTAMWGFYGLALLLFAAAAHQAGLGWGFWPLWLASGVHLGWQIRQLDIDAPEICLRLFRSNREFGLILFAAMVAGAASA